MNHLGAVSTDYLTLASVDWLLCSQVHLNLHDDPSHDPILYVLKLSRLARILRFVRPSALRQGGRCHLTKMRGPRLGQPDFLHLSNLSLSLSGRCYLASLMCHIVLRLVVTSLAHNAEGLQVARQHVRVPLGVWMKS